MTDPQKNWMPVLAEFLLELADDQLIIGHRNSQWCGHAPILEEDIAFANLSLDELGHAVLVYELYSSLVGEDPETFPDRLVFTREAFEYRNCHLAALPNGDWAFTMLRQYLMDSFEFKLMEALAWQAVNMNPCLPLLAKSYGRKPTIFAIPPPGYGGLPLGRMNPISGCRQRWISPGRT
jgi:1,2-phenylacetyl-CoA epoxidase catalytic subunit